MAKIERFEDIEGWQRARVLTRNVYSISKHGEFARDWGLRDQMRRASVSIMSNIAEGFERGGNKEFVQFTLRLMQDISTSPNFSSFTSWRKRREERSAALSAICKRRNFGEPNFTDSHSAKITLNFEL